MIKDIETVQKEIVESFQALDDWLDRYDLLVSLGRELPPFSDNDRNEKNAISGCQSNVWIKMDICDGNMVMTADSDASITKGILALLISVLNHRTPKEISDSDLFFISETGLSSNLSPSRSDGLVIIIRTIKEFAQTNNGN